MIDKIKSLYSLIEHKNNEISNKFLSFITKANELVELSNDDYQIERSFKLNKISLKGFVLESPCCKSLKSNNIANYSIDELKDYLSKYENTYNEDCSKYFLAIMLYELLEDIESLIDSKIDLGLSFSKALRRLIEVEKVFGYNVECLKYYVGLEKGFVEMIIDYALNKDELKYDVKKMVLEKVSQRN